MSNKGIYPSKTTINLAMKEKSKVDRSSLKPLLIILVAVLVVALAVVYPLVSLFVQKAHLADNQAKVAELEEAVVQYDALKELYDMYSVKWMTEDEKALIDRMEIIKLIEDEIKGYCHIRSIDIQNNMFAVLIFGLSLEDTSRIVDSIYGYENVRNIEVINAAKDENEKRVYMTVTMGPKVPDAVVVEDGVNGEGGVE